jgi:general secretion pathway protein C
VSPEENASVPFGRSTLAQTSIVFTMKVGALALLGFVWAYWGWAWFAPSPLPQAMEVSEPAGRLANAGDLFGKAQDETHPGAPTALAVTLLGVMAGAPAGAGHALLQLGKEETRLVPAGGDLAPGIRVESVFPERVVLRRNGARETLAWPRTLSATSNLTVQ